MTMKQTLAKAMAVTAEQLTGMTPPEADALAAALHSHLGAVQARESDTLDSLHRRLGERQQGGRDYHFWPTSHEEAEQAAAAKLAEDGLRFDIERELRDILKSLQKARTERPAAERALQLLNAEYDRRGGWTRFYHVPGGHIHTGLFPRQCSTLRPTTTVLFVAELSGTTMKDAVDKLGPVLCSHCYPDAPVEWQRSPEDLKAEAEADKVCGGTGEYAKLMTPRMARRVSRYADCHVCGKELVSVTSNSNLRKHNKPGA